MYCSNCGTFNNSTNFCANCGNGLSVSNNKQMGSITIIRPKSFFGCAFSYNVYIDNCFMGSIGNGKRAQYFVPYGNHTIEIRHGLNKGKTIFYITDVEKNLVIECPLKMGLITNKVEFNLINFYN